MWLGGSELRLSYSDMVGGGERGGHVSQTTYKRRHSSSEGKVNWLPGASRPSGTQCYVLLGLASFQ